MQIERIGEVKTVFSGEGKHDYFAWPSVTRTKDGKIVTACSGYRLGHICPFGKAVQAVSTDEGETYTPPQIVIDTVLDDRDAGLCPFGENGLILTSFNNSTAFQKKIYKGPFGNKQYRARRKYALAYLKNVTPEAEEKALGVTFKVSFDGGVTFGPLYKSPITSPHGPVELSDGTILWVGRTYTEDDSFRQENDCISAYIVDPTTGAMECIGRVEDIFENGKKTLSCEPHAIELASGKIICHIRVENRGGERLFTLYQTESTDGGKNWTRPRRILEPTGGAPAHLLLHSSGALVSTYGYRNDPPSVRAIISYDEGVTWSAPQILFDDLPSTPDMGYPCSVETKDGEIITVFYAHPSMDEPANILQQRWRIKR